MVKILLTITCVLLTSVLSSQTQVPRRVKGTENWTKAGSPYIITDTCIIDTNAIVTVGPGVKIQFKNKLKKNMIQILGSFIVEGSESEPVVMEDVYLDYLALSPAYDTLTGNGNRIRYAELKFQGTSTKGIRLVKSAILLEHVITQNGYDCVRGDNLSSVYMRNCEMYGILSGGNGNGSLSSGSLNHFEVVDTKVRNFQNIDAGRNGKFIRADIEVKHYYAALKVAFNAETFTMLCSRFKGYNRGLDLTAANENLDFYMAYNTFDSLSECFTFNCGSKFKSFYAAYNNFLRIYGNYFEHTAPSCSGGTEVSVLDISNNYWQKTDTFEINDKMEDNRDVSTLQFYIHYWPLLTEEYTECELPNVSIVGQTKHEFEIYPQPAFNKLHIVGDLNNVTGYKILSVDGRDISKGNFIPDQGIDVNNVPDGIYMIELQFNTGASAYQKIIVSRN